MILGVRAGNRRRFYEIQGSRAGLELFHEVSAPLVQRLREALANPNRDAGRVLEAAAEASLQGIAKECRLSLKRVSESAARRIKQRGE